MKQITSTTSKYAQPQAEGEGGFGPVLFFNSFCVCRSPGMEPIYTHQLIMRPQSGCETGLNEHLGFF